MSAFLGESYDYWKSIKQPSAMGMSPGFSLSALATNVDGLLSYVEVLISGTGNASKCSYARHCGSSRTGVNRECQWQILCMGKGGALYPPH